MNTLDVRWKQRFSNLNKAFDQLTKFINAGELNELEAQGLIKSFEYTYELSWKTLQDYLKENGFIDVVGPRPVLRQSFQNGYIEDGQEWLDMLDSRNKTSHTYDEEVAEQITRDIVEKYYPLFKKLINTFENEI